MGDGELKRQLKFRITHKEQHQHQPVTLQHVMEVIDEVVAEMKRDFPTLEAGSFSKHPSGDIVDYWAKEVLAWKQKWLGETTPQPR